MTVFKYYFKIVQAHKTSILIYTIVFFVMAIIFFTNKNQAPADYKSIRVNVHVLDESQTFISKALVDYLEKETNVKDIDISNVKDELFYGGISAIITIPKDFSATRKLLYESAPKDSWGFLVRQKIEQYLSKIFLYQESGFSEKEAVEFTNEDLKTSIAVSLVNKEKKIIESALFAYFNFLNYPIMAQILLIISLIMVAFQEKTVLKRNEVSPVSKTSKTLSLLAGHSVCGIFLWLFYIMLTAFFFKDAFLSKTHLLLCLNSFVLMISCVTMGMFLTRLFTDAETLSKFVTFLSLASSFLAGAFVPRFLLGKTALTLGRAFPSYYYILNNEKLANNPTFSAILSNLLIMLGFSAGFIVLSIFLKPKRRDLNN